MALSPAQILEAELAQLGLKPGASQDQIQLALKTKYPGGTGAPNMDPRTGLPYTSSTAKDAGSGNLAGNIIGGGLFGYVVGDVVGAVAAAGDVADLAAGENSTDAGIGGGSLGDANAVGTADSTAAGVGAGAGAAAGGLATGVTALSSFLSKFGLGFLGDLSFWKGLGLVLGGVLILFVVGKELVSRA